MMKILLSTKKNIKTKEKIIWKPLQEEQEIPLLCDLKLH